MHTPFKFIIVTLLGLLVISCDYKLDKTYFNDIEPPQEYAELDISLTPAGDTIFIFGETEITYKLNESGYVPHHNSRFIFKDDIIQLGSQLTKTFTINPEYRDFRIDTLTLQLTTSTNSGSLADKVGVEAYYLEKDWIVITDTREPDNLNVDHEITQEGFLKIIWDKCEQYNFKAYEVEWGSEKVSIDNKEINYYTDSTFIGGSYSYFVKNHVYWPSGSFWSYGVEQINYNLPRLKINSESINQATIYWEKSPFNCNYTLLDESDNILVNSKTITSIKIPRIIFDISRKYKLYISPYNKDHKHPLARLIESSLYTIEEQYHYGYKPNFAYNPHTNNLYSLVSLDLYSHKGIEAQSYNSRYHLSDWPTGVGAIACPTNSSQVAMMARQYIRIFQDEQLNNEISIAYKNSQIEHFLFSNTNQLAIVADGKFELLDINTKEVIATIELPSYPEERNWSRFTTSQDSKYFCLAKSDGLLIYDLSNGNPNLHYSDTRTYKSAYFNPSDPNQLLLTTEENQEVEVRNVIDFSLERTIDLPSSMFVENIDPVSNYLLLTDEEKITVVDFETGNEIFSIKYHPGYQISLFSNKLFSRRGDAVDITPYLP
ncbi:hypothetical protein [Marinifilum fragile]|uniref:hypothetical protein n=1 Tax=Marinifilum fragile TaxID=570161 RepID=UPI002AAACDB9|nr:hypothetical protein [Marinifilum fragile]